MSRTGTIFFTVISDKGAKRLYFATLKGESYEPAQPLPFSDGTTLDVDPEIAPDESFLVFCSSGRMKEDDKDHLYLVQKTGFRVGDR